MVQGRSVCPVFRWRIKLGRLEAVHRFISSWERFFRRRVPVGHLIFVVRRRFRFVCYRGRIEGWCLFVVGGEFIVTAGIFRIEILPVLAVLGLSIIFAAGVEFIGIGLLINDLAADFVCDLTGVPHEFVIGQVGRVVPIILVDEFIDFLLQLVETLAVGCERFVEFFRFVGEFGSEFFRMIFDLFAVGRVGLIEFAEFFCRFRFQFQLAGKTEFAGVFRFDGRGKFIVQRRDAGSFADIECGLFLDFLGACFQFL